MSNPFKDTILKIFASVFLFFFCVLGFSQDWKASYTDALASSKDEDKPIVLVFAGSDWCAPCIKLEKNIWQSEAFKTHAVSNYILYKADFPRKKANALSPEIAKQNAVLADRFNAKGYFPLVVVLDKQERVLGQLGYQKIEPLEYISLLNNLVN